MICFDGDNFFGSSFLDIYSAVKTHSYFINVSLGLFIKLPFTPGYSIS